MTDQALVIAFSAIDPSALAIVGGKAANLGVLTRAGFPVPPGVCVTTEAYAQVAAAADVDAAIAALAATAPEDVRRLGDLAAEIRAAILAAAVPPAVADAILAGYASLGAGARVAVRSSATAEDLPFASFAGQQDTYLNVTGAEALLDATRRCWASLWTERAVAYRAKNGIDHARVHLAVVIQRMVDAEIAGVLFTANPVTGRRGHAVIDASPGLGEAVVSGAVNPDRFVVDALNGEILERRLGDKRLVIRARPDGGTEHVERASGADAACVSDPQIRAIAALGRRVESHYGAPQDTEWAIDSSGTLWLTQARPITTLYPLPELPPRAGEDLRVFFCFSLAQGLERPLTPMGLAVFRLLSAAASGMLGFPVARPTAGASRYTDSGGRIFADVTGVLRSRVGRAIFPRVLDVMEARSAVLLRALMEDPRLALVAGSKLGLARRALGIAARFRVPVTVARALASPAAARRQAERYGESLAARLSVPETATAEARLAFVERVILEECVPLLPSLMPAAIAGFAMLLFAGKILGDEATPDELQTVLRGLPHNVTTEMDLELWALAAQIRGDRDAVRTLLDSSAGDLAERFREGSLPPVAQCGVADFLARWGHRAVAEIDVGMPRWTDDPRHILGVLAGYLRIEASDAAPDAVFARGRAEAERMVDELVARARRKGRARARLVRFALDRARGLAGLRELPKYDLIVAFGAVRRELARIGVELASTGRLESADDVFFVDLDEARAGLGGRDLRALVRERRETYDRELRRRHIPRVLLSDGTEPEAALAPAAAPDGSLAGTPASAGSVSGVARVILDPVGARLEPGEILVAPSTDPGWTPLLLMAGGLVMEMGGANSHGAVVAREYGIPAVVGVRDATARIATGQRITVDGGAGSVLPA